jgi:hypothetical protein
MSYYPRYPTGYSAEPSRYDSYGSYPQYESRPAPFYGGARGYDGNITLKEENLRRHDIATGGSAGPSSSSPNMNAGAETVASSVGTQWRSIVTVGGTRKKVKSNLHPSRILPPVGSRMALLIGVDDESSAATNSTRLLSEYLEEFGYSVETVVDTGENPAQFEIDVEAGLAELIALTKPGDSIVLYAINFGTTGVGHSASTLLHRLVSNLPSLVRVTCIFDCCYLTAKPAYMMDPDQPKIYTARSAGLKHLRRLAKPLGSVTQKIPADIVCFCGENQSGKTMVCRTVMGMVGIYTTAVIRVLRNKSLKEGLKEDKEPSYAVIGAAIKQELSNIVFGSQPHNTKSEILCVKPYDIDQQFLL